jgi:hypothetical protein
MIEETSLANFLGVQPCQKGMPGHLFQNTNCYILPFLPKFLMDPLAYGGDIFSSRSVFQPI